MVVTPLAQLQPILQARFSLTKHVDPAPERGDALADVQVQPFDKRGIDGPAASRQHLLNGEPGAKHHAVCDADEAPTPIRLDNLSIEQLGQRHPTRLQSWPSVLAPFGVYPKAKMRQ